MDLAERICLNITEESLSHHVKELDFVQIPNGTAENHLQHEKDLLAGYVPQHRTLKLQDTRQDREQHHEISTQTRMIERHHGKKMSPVAPPTIERRRQLIVTATQ
ncbi:hypothetical protein AVEN_248782-1 [Araneus ventricosus]|uniref:Uncharacterized protein n=1 Tax=Araneus ventricosus TaxID=182803 RepID=A0A4Y2LEB7_ARAVE|nr:hypothetical protein AVEN_248782-1 [Araneus ventricosus]